MQRCITHAHRGDFEPSVIHAATVSTIQMESFAHAQNTATRAGAIDHVSACCIPLYAGITEHIRCHDSSLGKEEISKLYSKLTIVLGQRCGTQVVVPHSPETLLTHAFAQCMETTWMTTTSYIVNKIYINTMDP